MGLNGEKSETGYDGCWIASGPDGEARRRRYAQKFGLLTDVVTGLPFGPPLGSLPGDLQSEALPAVPGMVKASSLPSETAASLRLSLPILAETVAQTVAAPDETVAFGETVASETVASDETVARACVICGGSLEGRRPQVRTCSKSCRDKLHRIKD